MQFAALKIGTGLRMEQRGRHRGRVPTGCQHEDPTGDFVANATGENWFNADRTTRTRIIALHAI